MLQEIIIIVQFRIICDFRIIVLELFVIAQTDW